MLIKSGHNFNKVISTLIWIIGVKSSSNRGKAIFLGSTWLSTETVSCKTQGRFYAFGTPDEKELDFLQELIDKYIDQIAVELL